MVKKKKRTRLKPIINERFDGRNVKIVGARSAANTDDWNGSSIEVTRFIAYNGIIAMFRDIVFQTLDGSYFIFCSSNRSLKKNFRNNFY